jgi:hypothetical protein
MNILQGFTKGLYRCHALDLLERIEPGKIGLVYLDPPWLTFSSRDEETKTARKLLLLYARVCEQSRRVLADSGSLILHINVDWVGEMSALLNEIFGPKNFVDSYVWQQHGPRVDSFVPGRYYTVLLHYRKSENFVFHPPMMPLSKEERSRYRNDDPRGPYMLVDLTGSNAYRTLQYEWKGYRLPPNRSWRYSQSRLDQLDAEGLIYHPQHRGTPRLKQFLSDKAEEVPVGSIWSDIPSPLRNVSIRMRHETREK